MPSPAVARQSEIDWLLDEASSQATDSLIDERMEEFVDDGMLKMYGP